MLRYGFGLSDDVPQTSSSSADLDQLALQGGVYLLNPPSQLAINHTFIKNIVLGLMSDMMKPSKLKKKTQKLLF